MLNIPLFRQLFFGAISCFGVLTPHVALSEQGSVKVERVAKVFIANGKPALAVSYQYSFPAVTVIHISGLGVVPATGTFRYISGDTNLEFSDVDTGKIIMTQPLLETAIVSAKAPLTEVPNIESFPIAYKAFTWRSQKSLQSIANAVLGNYFRYLPNERDHIVFFETTYAPVPSPGLSSNVLAQVALLLSFPYDSDGEKYSFRVQSILREGRSHSDDFRATDNPQITKAADAFVDGLMAEMQRAGDHGTQ
jgi:hypothetical protein